MITRDPWIDCLRAIGMLLVFHGHVVELAYDETIAAPPLFWQFQTIYAFHMPLFFLASGFVAKPPAGRFSDFLSGKFFNLVLPASFFVITIGLLHQGLLFLWQDDLDLHKIARVMLSPFGGFPAAAWPTWFLFCMFTAYVLFWITYPVFFYIGKWLFMPVLFAVASVSILKIEFFTDALHIQTNFWYVNNAPMACFFLYLGHIAATEKLHPARLSNAVLLGIGVVSLVACWLTATLNQDLEKGAVILAFAQIGHPAFFLTSAVFGILGTACLTQILVKFPFLALAGRYSLPLLFFACLFFQLGNAPLLMWLDATIKAAPVLVTCAVTFATFVVSLPLAVLLQKLLPQFFGVPHAKGPILPALKRS